MIRFLLPVALIFVAPMALAQSALPLIPADPPSTILLAETGNATWSVSSSAARGNDDCLGDEVLEQKAITSVFGVGGAVIIGQSFVALCTGVISVVHINLYNHPDAPVTDTFAGELHIYEGQGGGGELIFDKDIFLDAPESGGLGTPHEFHIMDDVEVTQGEVYTFAIVGIDGTMQLTAVNENLYAEGALLRTDTGDPANMEPFISGTGQEFDATFAIEFAEPIVSTEVPLVGQSLHLGAAYPNPASGSVVIPIQLDAAQHLHIALYDLLGREVVVVAEGLFAAGSHEISLDVSSFAAGLYVYRASVDGNAFARRLVVVE